VISIAKHQAKTEELVVFEDVKNQIHEVAIYIIQVKDEEILLLLLINSLSSREQDFL
jgi:hypothetical protein